MITCNARAHRQQGFNRQTCGGQVVRQLRRFILQRRCLVHSKGNLQGHQPFFVRSGPQSPLLPLTDRTTPWQCSRSRLSLHPPFIVLAMVYRQLPLSIDPIRRRFFNRNKARNEFRTRQRQRHLDSPSRRFGRPRTASRLSDGARRPLEVRLSSRCLRFRQPTWIQ
jgi:hypothetical protein